MKIDFYILSLLFTLVCTLIGCSNTDESSIELPALSKYEVGQVLLIANGVAHN